jgi:vitamin B12 transporter
MVSLGMLHVLAAAIAVTSPSPSPTAPAPPEIAHVVTSDRSQEAISRTARTTYVVTKTDMVRDGDITVADAVQNVPGVTLNRYGGFGAQTSLSIRGSSTQQVLVLLDGMPVAGAQLDGVDLAQYATSGIERVEVVEGGGSTLYGSGSVGGIVNIITAHPAAGNASASLGSFNTSSVNFETPLFSFSHTYAANAYGFPDGTSQANAQATLTSGTIHYEHRFGSIDTTLSGNLASLLNGAPGPYGFTSPTSEQSAVNLNGRLTLAHSTPNATTTLQLASSAYTLGFTCDTPVDSTCFNYLPPPPAQPPFSQVLRDQRLQASLRNVVGNGNERLVYGLDFSRGFARIDDGLGDPVEVYAYSQSAAYAQAQWSDRHANAFYAGLRGELDGAQGGAFSPSLGTIVHLSPGLLVRANAATAFDAPDAELLYYPGYSNPNLAPERLKVGDATLDAPALLGGTSLSWFVTGGSNLIVSNPPSYIPENVGHTLVEGFTLDTKTLPVHGLVATLAVTNLYRAQDLDNGTRLNYRGAVFSTRLGLTYTAPVRNRFDGFGVTVTSNGSQAPVDGTQPAWTQPIPFTNVDAYLGYRVAARALLRLRGYDLGNERYALYAGYPLPGRAFALELSSR